MSRSLDCRDFDVKLVHAFDIRMNFFKRVIFGPVSGGAKQGYVSFKDGVHQGSAAQRQAHGVQRRRLGHGAHGRRGRDQCALHARGRLTAPIYIHNRGYIYNTQPNAPGRRISAARRISARPWQTRLAQSHGHRRAAASATRSRLHDLPLLHG
jgi:hypothetical protein